MTYHLWQDGGSKGPFTLGQLRAMWNGGTLTVKDLFSRNEGEDWHYLGDIIEELEPPKPVLVPTRSTEELEVLKKIEQSQIQTKNSTGFLSTVAKVILSIVGFIIVGIITIWILLSVGQSERGTFQTIPEISSESSQTTTSNQ